MLVFDSQESFDKTLAEVEKMSSDERKAWEEKLGFKSYDRLKSEIIENETAYTAKFESLSEDKLQLAIQTGEYQSYSPLAQKYIEKGIVRKENKNGEEYMKFKKTLYPLLVNEDGFVVVGDEIRQYAENQYKVIKSRDFDKIKELSSINSKIDNQFYFVTDYNIQRNTKSLGVAVDKSACSETIDKKQIEITEYAISYNTGGINYRSYFQIWIENWKKNIWGNWKHESARTWYECYFYVTTARYSSVPPYTDIVYTTTYKTFTEADVQISNSSYVLFDHSWGYGGSTMPEWMIPTFTTPSLFRAIRWGGSSGIGVRINDFNEVKKYW